MNPLARVAALGLLLALAGTVASAAMTAVTDPSAWQQLPTGDGRLVLQWRAQQPLTVGRHLAWSVRVLDHADRPVDVALSLRGGMPAHGHGLPGVPQIRRVATGEFVVDGLLFNMPGRWVMDFQLQEPGRPATRARLALQLPP